MAEKVYTVDVIVRQEDQILLVERKYWPFKGMLAIPGGRVDSGEELRKAAVRELNEETSLNVLEEDLVLVGVYNNPDRDPRGDYESHVYFAKKFTGEVEAKDDAADTAWIDVSNLPKLAFDHNTMIEDYLRKC